MKTFPIIFALFLSILFTGCYTYYPARGNLEDLKNENDNYVRITKFCLQNGDTINVKDYEVTYYEKYNKNEKVFVCTESNPNEKNQIFYNSSTQKEPKKIIPAEQVKSVIVEKRKINTLKTVIVASSITIVSLAALFVLIVGSSVKSIHGNVLGG